MDLGEASYGDTQKGLNRTPLNDTNVRPYNHARQQQPTYASTILTCSIVTKIKLEKYDEFYNSDTCDPVILQWAQRGAERKESLSVDIQETDEENKHQS